MSDALETAILQFHGHQLYKEGRALSLFFGPPWKPKIKSYLTTLCLDCFIRRMIKVFLFHIDWALTVTMVTENGRQNRLKSKNVILSLKLEV